MSNQYANAIGINTARFIANREGYERAFSEYEVQFQSNCARRYRIEFFGDFSPSHYSNNSDAPFNGVVEKCKQHLMHSNLFEVHMVNNADGFLKDMFWITGKTGVIFYRGKEMVTHISGDMLSYADFRTKLATLDVARAEHSPKMQDLKRKQDLRQASSSGCCTIM
ncbi:hypothetical protein GGI15_003939 [Coemansia interrupta]|uniref:Uncharacterized protein n=1 Tax=Coemansia interrupta TaxID=1126814 RepID=A0A9W8LHC9_9FUNG|nr:hypothetical protein GGI15_003939 [Coemansia interrupta]